MGQKKLLDIVVASNNVQYGLRVIGKKTANDVKPKGRPLSMATEQLWVNSFDSTSTAWTEVGDSPYLNDDITSNVNDWHDGYDERYFGFADSGVGAGSINSVTLYIEGYTNVAASSEEQVTIYVNDGSSDNDMGEVSLDIGTPAYETVDCSAVLNTWAKIDAAELWLENFGAGYVRYVQRAYLLVDYTAAGGLSIPVAMRTYRNMRTAIVKHPFHSCFPKFTPTVRT